MSDDTTSNDDSIVGELAESIDRARLAAEAALNVRFTENTVVGYGQRSMVFLRVGRAEGLHPPVAGTRLPGSRWPAGCRAGA